ncbi:unnamed protein product [Rotaria socialis]|uniref:Uncharacterized protein n=1 Tax=Rotaria socialis TaxID=392032 RepID=A0A818K4H7_9BILA|nr:unnamed protein product [Rotaria socialis]
MKIQSRLRCRITAPGITGKYGLFTAVPPDEILVLTPGSDSSYITYIKGGHRVQANFDINDLVYSLVLQFESEALIEEFLIDDYIDQQKTPSASSTVVRNIDEFITRIIDVINKLEEHIQTQTQE